jgi:multidrug efflux pump subunit AcrB
MLRFTRSAINVQSLLRCIFMVAVLVSNTVLLIDLAQNLRVEEGLSPTEAIRKSAGQRVRPMIMTALAALFSLIPMSMALARGGEANAPLGRATVGGLAAGLFVTFVIVPALYSLMIRDTPSASDGAPAPAGDLPERTELYS